MRVMDCEKRADMPAGKTAHDWMLEFFLLYNLVYCIIAFIFLPAADLAEAELNTMLGLLTLIGGIFFVTVLRKTKKEDTAARNLLLISFAAAMVVLYKWVNGFL